MSDITTKLPSVIGVPLRVSLQFMKLIVTISGFLMAITFTLVVIIRYGFAGDLYAYEEWLLAFSFWGFFAGAVLASHQQLHINADILGMVIHDPKARYIRQLVVLTVELIVVVAIAYWGYLMVAEEISYYPRWKMTPALKIPYVVWRAGIFIAFSYMSVFSAAFLYVHIKEGVDGFAKAEKEKENAKEAIQ